MLLTRHVASNIPGTTNGTQAALCGRENELSGMLTEVAGIYPPVDNYTNIGIHLTNGSN
jgi:hypothetical protein